MNNSDMPAMPQPIASHIDEVIDTKEYCPENAGLTKREHFAGLAMQGILANSGGAIQANSQSGFGWCNCDDEQMAKLSLDCADALLAELDKPIE
tara:strand:+ start:258 stop:539 length:282 start_codon:yes stop_codon:yes gene_type:complete